MVGPKPAVSYDSTRMCGLQLLTWNAIIVKQTQYYPTVIQVNKIKTVTMSIIRKILGLNRFNDTDTVNSQFSWTKINIKLLQNKILGAF